MDEIAGSITQLLHRSRAGDSRALNELLPLVYGELRAQAARAFQGERRAITLQPTALLHETYMKLMDHSQIQWHDRRHFFAVAARLMRQILVDHARARGADKRGGADAHVTLDSEAIPTSGDQEARFIELLALDEVMTRLEARDPRLARVVELRVFAGLTVDETADVLSLSPRTIKSDWQLARAWLIRALG